MSNDKFAELKGALLRYGSDSPAKTAEERYTKELAKRIAKNIQPENLTGYGIAIAATISAAEMWNKSYQNHPLIKKAAYNIAGILKEPCHQSCVKAYLFYWDIYFNKHE